MDRQLEFALKKFSEFYSHAHFSIPEIEKREFGAGIEKKIDSRHMGFSSEQEFRAFLVHNTPLYVSHSVAYYRLPRATPMEKKVWLGADLVFDLDFEAQSKYLSHEDFEKVRSDAIRLVEEFLIPDFGVDKNKLSVNFSGNRGFHIHVRDPAFSQLRGEERREIIDYVKGIGLKYDSFFTKEEAGETGGRSVYREAGPTPSGSGYSGRFAKKVLEILESDPTSLSRVFKDESRKKSFSEGIKKGNWSLRKLTPSLDKKLREIADSLALRAVNIDAGVTQDAAKLIRVPGSLHGSTGLCAKTIPLAKLPEFEPTKDALAFQSNPIRITALEDIPEIEFAGSTQEKIEKNQMKELPGHFALYLILKGSAKL